MVTLSHGKAGPVARMRSSGTAYLITTSDNTPELLVRWCLSDVLYHSYQCYVSAVCTTTPYYYTPHHSFKLPRLTNEDAPPGLYVEMMGRQHRGVSSITTMETASG